MKNKIRFLPLACVFLHLNTPAYAQNTADDSAGELVRLCLLQDNAAKLTRMEDIVDMGYCLAYFDGFGDAHTLWDVFSKETILYCVPKTGITLNDMRRVFLQYMATRPEAAKNRKRVAVSSALMDAFPCSKK